MEPLTVLQQHQNGSISGAPTIYLLLPDATDAGSGGSGGGAQPPAVHRQGSGFRALQKLVKRWKPCLATELDRFLGEGAVRDRVLLVELLDVDTVGEMPEVMNMYRIPMAQFEAWIGTKYDERADGKPRRFCWHVPTA